ncbi:hypothetical protein EVG20_g2289 [Dentipellis fragilis]|uniref:Protein kinase domain-containing protein n=1 Tax=Dentipellis fragilis TaxID=205917 RepID=A0A4Y9ZA93_9AGAM|nr:hypothetical protein EVG20_g2289 [Dentipellis fragilis]
MATLSPSRACPLTAAPDSAAMFLNPATPSPEYQTIAASLPFVFYRPNDPKELGAYHEFCGQAIEIRIIRARDLPSPRLWPSSVNSFVLVTPEGRHLFRTETVSGPNPEWNELFVVRCPSRSSTIRLQVLHSSSTSETTLLGETDVPVDVLLRDDVDEYRCRLTKSGLKFRRNRGELFVSGNIHINVTEAPSAVHTSPSARTEPVGDLGDKHEAVPTSNGQPSLSTPGYGLQAGGISSLFVQLHSASFPPIEPNTSSLSRALGEAEDNVNALLAPSFLQKAGPYMNGVTSAGSSDLSEAAGDVLSNVLDNVVHPYAKLAWTVLSSGYKILKAQVDRDDRIRNLWHTVQDVVVFFDEVKEEPTRANYLKQAVMDVMKQIYECCQFLRKYADKGFAGRTFWNTLNPKNDDAVQLLTDSFRTLKDQLNRGISLDNWKCIRALGNDLGEVKDQVQELWLYTLIEGQVNVVECDTRRGCLPETRTKLIGDIVEWIHDPERGRVLWLSGPVGTGKSSVANTVAGLLKGLGRLGASYRFDKQVDPSAVFRQIAYQLARVDKSVKDALLSMLKQKGDIASAALSDQALGVIVEPLKAVDLVGPVVIVIDALDEIRHREARVRDDILAFFSHEDFALPDYVKIFITSRDDPQVHLHLQPGIGGCEALNIDDYEDTAADIHLFVRHRLGEISARARITDGWPPSGADEKLAERAGRQFQWAYITCQFIAESPRSRLSLVLSAKVATHGGSRQLDVLYDSVIRSAYEARDRDSSYVSEFGYVVGCIAAGKKPFRLRDLNDLLKLDNDRYSQVFLPGRESFLMEGAEQVVSSVRSLFSATTTPRGNLGALRLVHTSLFEFLTDSKRCPDFHIDLSYWNLVLAIRCMKILNERLDTESSIPRLLKKDGPRRARPFSNALRYACVFFAQHISHTKDRQNDSLVPEIMQFTSRRLLRWIEEMSNLGFEWKEGLDVLIASYELPPGLKLLVGAVSAEDRKAVMNSIVDDGDLPAVMFTSVTRFDPDTRYDYIEPFNGYTYTEGGHVEPDSTAETPQAPIPALGVEEHDEEETWDAVADGATHAGVSRRDDNDVINVIPDAQAVEMLEPTLDLERPFYSLGYVSSIHAWYRQSKIPASRYEKYANVQNNIESAWEMTHRHNVSADRQRPAASTLSNCAYILSCIWSILAEIRDPRLRFLDLVERCATILLEVSELYAQYYPFNDQVIQATESLVDCFGRIRVFFLQEAKASFIKRTFKRRGTEEQLVSYAERLWSIMQGFEVSLQTSVLARIQKSTRQTLLNLEGLGKSDTNTQDKIRKLAERILSGQENSDDDSGPLEDGADLDSHTSFLRNILEDPAYLANTELRFITKHDLEIDGEICRGVQSTVQKCIWQGQTVAVKMFSYSVLPSDYFNRTVTKWWTLHDPNILQLLAASVPTDLTSLYSVTPYYEKGSLVQYLNSKSNVEEPELLRMMIEIVSGLEYLHGKDIAHGNLQGENVLVADDLTCLIGGFSHSGLGVTVPRQDESEVILREEMLGWYAPEILNGADPFTRVADVYAFSMICVEILKRGVPPWEPCSKDTMCTIVFAQADASEGEIYQASDTARYETLDLHDALDLNNGLAGYLSSYPRVSDASILRITAAMSSAITSFTSPVLSSATPDATSTSTSTGNDGGGSTGPSPGSSSLYLYTFLATLLLLLSVSGVIIFRSMVIRRRHRQAVLDAIAQRDLCPPIPSPGWAHHQAGRETEVVRGLAHPGLPLSTTLSSNQPPEHQEPPRAPTPLPLPEYPLLRFSNPFRRFPIPERRVDESTKAKGNDAPTDELPEDAEAQVAVLIAMPSPGRTHTHTHPPSGTPRGAKPGEDDIHIFT